MTKVEFDNQAAPRSGRTPRGLMWLLAILAGAVAFAFFGPDSWTRQLRAATRDADRIRVRSGGTCHRKPESERTLFELTDPAKVQAALARIRVRRALSWMHCRCCGEPTIEVYQGDKLVANLGLHHGKLIRWPGVWSCDAELESEAASSLTAFLAEHGVFSP